jgi:hypothetical protein
MAELRRKRDILHQLVKARNAVKRKYNLLKYGKEKIEKAIGETFKPIVDPLQELVSESKIRVPEPMQTNVEIPPPEAPEEEITAPSETSEETIRNEDDYTLEEEHLPDTTFDTDDTKDEAASIIKQEEDIIEQKSGNRYLDKIYGVRKEGNHYMIGNSPIYFQTKHEEVKGMKYPKTVGLQELLYTKHPDVQLVTAEDLANYRSILETTSAHRKQYRSDAPIRTHTSRKYTDIIAPLFRDKPKNKKGGTLPLHKVARRNSKLDYVYWDDPNELVDRLRLLMAERSAGNSSHTNEIRSIIEELREAGYIY